MNNESIFVTKPSLPPFQEYIAEIYSIWETRQLTNTGSKYIELQEQLEGFLDVKHVSLFANGHLALELAIQALGLKGEVITTPFTFASTTQAILRCGLKPVFCDIKPDDHTIDCDKIEELITDQTTAIIPVHVFSNICEVDKLQKIADKHNLKIIYDAAHAFGESYKGKPIGHYGDITMFSFHATKVFHTIEGGCLTFSNGAYIDILNNLKQFGQTYSINKTTLPGTNAKMSEFHAAMGLCNLRHIDDYILKREKIVKRYRTRLSGIPGINLCPLKKEIKYNYAYFPVVFDPETFGAGREDVFRRLTQQNIFAKKYFSPLTSELDYCKKLEIKPVVPVAQYISDRILVLPCYPELDYNDVDRICDIILST